MTAESGDGAKTETPRTIIVERHAGGLPLGKIALLLAAVIALIAIGVSVWKSRGDDAPVTAGAAPATAGPQPDVATMIATLEQRMKENPKDAEGWRMLGWSYYRTERFADAAAAYRKAVAIDPKNAEGWSALGEAIALAAPPPGAISAESEAAFRKAVAIDPANPRARYFLAVKRDLDGDHQGAIDDWLKLLKETPPGAPWEANVRQTILQVAGQHKIDVAGRMPAPSEPPANAATAAIPGPSPEQMKAATALPPGQQEDMVRGMVESLAAKLKANPQNADGWMMLMRARMVQGQQKEAAQALKDALAAFASDKAAQGRISDGARQLGVPGA